MMELHDVLEAKNEFLDKLGYVTDLVIVMNYSTFEMLTLPTTPIKTLGKIVKTLFGMEIKFNKLLEDGIFYIQTKKDYDLSNKLAKFITIDE